MEFRNLLKFFLYNINAKLNVNFNFIKLDLFLNSLRCYSFLFDIFTNFSDDLVNLYSILSDISYSTIKPLTLNYKYIYRGKGKVKVVIIQSLIKSNARAFDIIFKEIFYFVIPRYFVTYYRRVKFININLLTRCVRLNKASLNFTLSAFLFSYLLDDIDPIELRSFKINFLFLFESFNFFFWRILVLFFSMVFFFRYNYVK
jgi:hypothetical protein